MVPVSEHIFQSRARPKPSSNQDGHTEQWAHFHQPCLCIQTDSARRTFDVQNSSLKMEAESWRKRLFDASFEHLLSSF